MVVCFVGHRKISADEHFASCMKECISRLVSYGKADTFLFGSRSEFDALCLKIVTELKRDYPHIKRIYVRAAYPDIDDNYEKYLLTLYDETYIPETTKNAGKASYIKRNRHMIDRADLCVFYFDPNYKPIKRLPLSGTSYGNSGTMLAYRYAKSRNKEILNMFTIV